MVREASLKRTERFSSSARSVARFGRSLERTSAPRSLKESARPPRPSRASLSGVATPSTARTLSRLRRPSDKPAARCGRSLTCSATCA